MSLINRLRGLTRNHAVLIKNSSVIVIGNSTAAILGFVYWWLAARWVSPEIIGTVSGLVSLMGFIGLIGEAGLGTLLISEIAQWPGRERGLVSGVLLFVLLLSLGIGTAILLLSEQIFHSLSKPLLVDLCLVIGFGATGLSLVMDQAWLGMLETNFRMIRQCICSALKLMFLVIVIIMVPDISAIFGSWVAALLMSIISGEFLMRCHNKTFFHRPDFAILAYLKAKTMNHYRLDFGQMAPARLLPYLVTVVLSPSANAVFTVLWMVNLVAVMVPATLSNVLVTAIRIEPHHYRNQMKLSLGLSLAYALTYGLFIFLFSTNILELFNPAYAVIGGTNLRMLGFGMIGTAIKCHVCAAARLNNRMRETSVSIFLGALFELMCVAVGGHFGGLEGLGVAWMMATLIEAGLLLMVNPVYKTEGLPAGNTIVS
jgi:O-antigen/teichoic acid export membrane protein